MAFSQRPLVGVFDDVRARRHFHHDARHAAIDGALHVVHHAAREREDLRTQVALHDFLDRRRIARRHHRHAGFDAVHAGFGQPFGDADLVVLGEDHAGLLLAVAQRDVVKLHLLGEMQLLAHRLREIPRADIPLICLPGFLCHMLIVPFVHKKFYRVAAAFKASGLTGFFGACPLSTRTTSSAALVCSSSSDSSE